MRMEPKGRKGKINTLRELLLRISLPRTSVNKGKRARAITPALFSMIVRPLSGCPYLAIHLLKERLAPLVALLVIANHLELLYGKVV
jgi:hypothetical protein